MDEFRIGSSIWIPCTVNPGPFSDECVVRIFSENGEEWYGFVNKRWLKDKDRSSGENEVLSRVTKIENGIFYAQVPGMAPKGGWVHDSLNKVLKPELKAKSI